jgi:phenylalanyl-tRNA synthetase beta chain
MKISLRWLQEFVDVPTEPRRLKADLTMLGLNVESFAQVEDDWVLEVEVTTNRPDCLSHYGIARELATLYRQPLKPPELRVQETGRPAAETASIEIADPDLCARYCGRVVRNVQVKPSPEWLQRRLEAVGQRPINNVADVTNYVLMELGHPLHAFDLACLRQNKIIVRRARPGEPLRTLDGVNRTLQAEDLVIADGERPVALAGVMGGEDSEISSRTRAVLLESAWFEPVSIRRTAKSQGMHTEASHRFERGADIEMAPVALERAAEMIRQLAGGEILRGVIDVYPRPQQRGELVLRRCEILRILGLEVPWEESERILRSLGFLVEQRDDDAYRVTPPSFRLDVVRPVDLIEEVARHYGYDRLPARVRPAPPRFERDSTREKELAVSALLVALGYREIIPSSMVDPKENAQFTDRPPVVLANPLSQDASALRSSAVPSMLHALRWNLDRDQLDLRFFELGKIYTLGPQGTPDERRVLTLGATGHRRSASVHAHEKACDFFDLKGDLETLLEAFDLPERRFEPAECAYYEAGLSGCFKSEGNTVAVFGQLSQKFERDYKLRQAVWLAEVDFECLLKHPLRSPQFRPYAKFPAVERDFSLVVPDEIAYARLDAVLRALPVEELHLFRPVDLFRGGSIPPGHYSLLLRLTFQSQTRTLTSEEVARACRQVLAALEPLGVRLRSPVPDATGRS